MKFVTCYIRALLFYLRENGLFKTFRFIKRTAVEKLSGPRPFSPNDAPESITLGIMNVCNLRCPHCYLQAQEDTPKRFMEYALFERIIARIAPMIRKADQFNFSAVEALFHPDFFEMTKLVRSINPRLGVVINTNGMLLDEACVERLIENRLFRITVSLDGIKKSTVEDFKKGINFDKVVGNIRLLRTKGRGRFRVTSIFVAHRDNIGELLDYIDFCASLGVCAINITGFIAYRGDMLPRALYSGEGRPEIDRLFAAARNKAERFGIRLIYPPTRLTPSGCGWGGSMYIDLEGNLSPCVFLAARTHMVLPGMAGWTEPLHWGNVLKDDPQVIWTNPAAAEFRRQLHTRRLPPQCRLCATGYRVIC